MRKAARIRNTIIIAAGLLVGSGILVLAFLAFASGWEVIDMPPFGLPDKGHPKLDSQLNQLVHAELRGEGASFAQRNNIEVVDGAVRVIIECMSGQQNAASEAATNAGARLEASSGNLLQAVVPIAVLTTLAEKESITFIRLPRYPLPAAQ